MEIAFSWEMKFGGKISFAAPSHQVTANYLEFALALMLVLPGEERNVFVN
jgi:hypothetical protein